jgi:hypothetical protein
MTEDSFVFLFFCGGFVVAFCFLLFATFVRRSRFVRWFCFIGAFCGLIYEGGCFMTAAGVGKATGGGGDSDNLMALVTTAFFIAFAWCFALVFLVPIKKNENNLQSPGQNKNLADSDDDKNRMDTP